MYGYRNYLLVLFGSLAFSIGMQLLLPYPLGLAVSLGTFIILPMIYKKIVTRSGAGRFGGFEDSKFVKVCSICGKKTSSRECGRCGSRQFKIG